MKNELKIMLDNELIEKFEMALTLNKEAKEEAVDMLLKSYISKTFSKAATLYSNADNRMDNNDNEYYGKALHKIAKWANSPRQAIYKVIRAYFQLAENGIVYYSELSELCGNNFDHQDVYVPTFPTVFAQMKFDGEKSYGKVFEVSKDGIVSIWEYVENQLLSFKDKFLVCSTDIDYVNINGQRNIGKTGERGTDHCSVLYKMHCDKCGYEYYANSTDIHLKKCPQCQGGADTANIG